MNKPTTEEDLTTITDILNILSHIPHLIIIPSPLYSELNEAVGLLLGNANVEF